MSYGVDSTSIAVCFYNTTRNERDRFLQWNIKTDIIHCSIMLERFDVSILLAADTTHYAKFVSSSVIHDKVMTPCLVVDLGIKQISIEQLKHFIGKKYVGSVASTFIWYYITRHFFKDMLPKSCALITSQLLRICGYDVKDHIMPHTLLEELTNDFNSYQWQSWCRKNNICNHVS